jgi:hypothetical protein
MKWKFSPTDNSIRNHINFMYNGDIIAAINDKIDSVNIVSHPESIPHTAIREGTYYIRNKGSYHEIEYYSGYWFDKGVWPTDFAIHEFMLFPILSDKQYREMNKYKNMLSTRWRKNVDGYFRWLELRNIRRDTKYFMLNCLTF